MGQHVVLLAVYKDLFERFTWIELILTLSNNAGNNKETMNTAKLTSALFEH
jgi:hypothetical protein